MLEMVSDQLKENVFLVWTVWGLVSATLIVAAVIDGWKLKVPNWLTFPMVLSGWGVAAVFFGWSGLGCSLLGTMLGLGLLVSTVVQNQQQAMMGAAFVLMIPMIYLSGLLFPIENMPRAIQSVTYAIPVRYYAEILRGIFLRGSGIDVLWPQALVLLVTGVSIMTLAAQRFRKRLD